jgi:hypothetical protein
VAIFYLFWSLSFFFKKILSPHNQKNRYMTKIKKSTIIARLLAIESTRLEIVDLRLTMDQEIQSLLIDLQHDYRLADIPVLGIEIGWQSLEKKIYSIIQDYLVTNKRNDNGSMSPWFMSLSKEHKVSDYLPQINALLAHVGLYAQRHETISNRIIVTIL